MTESVEFQFILGQEVRIKAINIIGHIDGQRCDIAGKCYGVVYWNDGQRNSVWMYPWEIEEI